jgi:hypothetical protein
MMIVTVTVIVSAALTVTTIGVMMADVADAAAVADVVAAGDVCIVAKSVASVLKKLT